MTDKTDIEQMLSDAQNAQRDEAAGIKASGHWARWRRLIRWVKQHPKRSAVISTLLLFSAILVIPSLRYGISGLFIRRDIRINIVDAQTGEPVSKASVSMRGKTTLSDANGQIILQHNKPGEPSVTVEKQYYQKSTTHVKIGLLSRTYEETIKLSATGRAVPIRVTNRITGKGISGVSIVAGGTEGTTDDNGEVTMVFDPTVSTVEAEIKADDYNTTRANLTVPGDIAANTIVLTPTGRVYVLSKQSGNLDVVKVNLDGSDRQVVVKATGREEVANTELYQTSDWQFIILKARRDGAQAALYLIDTSTDKLTELDTAAVDFTIVGWHDHQFAYSTYDRSRQPWKPGQQELKVFDADSGKRTTIMSSMAQGDSYTNYATQSLAGVFIVDSKLVYATQWSGTAMAISKLSSLIQEVSLPSLVSRELRRETGASLIMVQPTPIAVNIQIITDQARSYQYLNGSITELNVTTEQLLQTTALYIPNQAGQYIWDEPTNGANQVLVSDAGLRNKQLLTEPGEFHAFGWFGNEYVLLSSGGSELFILPADPSLKAVPQKVVDYHRPPQRGMN